MSLHDEHVDIFIYCQEPTPQLAVCRDAFRRLTPGPHTLHVICEPGTMQQNWMRGFKLCKNRFVVSAHDDVEVLEPNWRESLLDAFEADQKLGLCGPVQIDSDESLAVFRQDPESFRASRSEERRVGKECRL